jgi:hypothetical protein
MRTVEMKLGSGETVLVEVDDVVPSSSGYKTPTGTAGATLLKQLDFKETIAKIKEPAAAIIDAFKDIPVLVDKASVEFSIKFSGEGGIIFASAKGEAGMVIKLEWTPKVSSPSSTKSTGRPTKDAR